MFYYLLNKMSFFKGENKLLKILILGSIFYILVHALLYGKLFETNELIIKYRKYIYYIVASDFALIFLMNDSSNQSKDKSIEQNTSDIDETYNEQEQLLRLQHMQRLQQLQLQLQQQNNINQNQYEKDNEDNEDNQENEENENKNININIDNKKEILRMMEELKKKQNQMQKKEEVNDEVDDEVNDEVNDEIVEDKKQIIKPKNKSSEDENTLPVYTSKNKKND